MLSLVLLAVLGTTVLTRFAPGYFTDSREMDALHGSAASLELQQMRSTQGSLTALLTDQLHHILHADLGRSRQFDVSVVSLLKERAGASVRLILRGVAAGWLVAAWLALLVSARRSAKGEVLLTGFTALLLAVPVGAMATVCLLLGHGGPVLVLALLIAVRDFKLLYRLLRVSWHAPFVLYGRAQGLPFTSLVQVHILPTLARELVALGTMSFVVALSALVPIEVVFDLPGLGQLAWSAATNRDLPVLVAVTALLAACVGLAGVFASPARAVEVAKCA